jgi:quercetin 2,3-dioxygenase
MATVERSVLKIDRPEVQQGMTPQHRVRPLMPAAMRGDFAATDPFLALMEDWFPRGVFGKHPHRGIETVTMSSGDRDLCRRGPHRSLRQSGA